MTDRHHRADDYRPLNPLWGTIALLSFGLAVLTFLVLLEKQTLVPLEKPARISNAALYAATTTDDMSGAIN